VGLQHPLSFLGPEEVEEALAAAFGAGLDGGGYGLTFIAPEHQLPPGGFRPARDVLAFTALREPRARIVSHYYEKLSQSGHDGAVFAQQLRDWHRSGPPVARPDSPTLEEFLRVWMLDGRQDNFMVRYFLGLRNVDHTVTAADLEAAKAVLRDQMEFVLITERLDEAGCFFDRLGWGDPERVRVRRPSLFGWLAGTAGRGGERALADPGSEEGALMDRLTALDQDLYAYAVELFEEQLALCECCAAGAGGGEAR